MIKEVNDIKIVDRIKELVIDWLVICIYLIILVIISLSFYMIVFKGIPKVTELQSQLIATITSVIPIIIIFSILDFKKGSIGKQKAGLKLYFKKREFKYSIIRNIVKFLPWQIGHMATIHGIYTEFDTISIILQIIALTLLVTMFLMGILRKDKRHLGDIVAGTQVQYEESDIINGELIIMTENEIEEIKPINIFVTHEDRVGDDITKMSDFFEVYISSMMTELKSQPGIEMNNSLKIVNDTSILQNISSEIKNIFQKENVTLIPDLEKLPWDVREKLKTGEYCIGKSRQVDGNLRAVIVNENNVRVKDITLKRISNNNINTQMITSIINQMQIQQIFTKLTSIEEFQTYQIETDRNSRMIRPFLDARDYAIKAENTNNKEKKTKLLEKAEEKVTSALNEVYLDLNTTKDEFIKSVKVNPGLNLGNNTDKFMKLLLSDIQLITKYTGVKMQLLEYLGENNMSKKVLEKYLNTIHSLISEPTENMGGQSVMMVLHDYFPYNEKNLDSFYYFTKDMRNIIKENILQLESNNKNTEEIYIISAED